MSLKHADPIRTDGSHGVAEAKRLWFAATTMVAIACLDLIEPVANLPFRVPRNINEGWNAYWATAVVSGAQLYPPMDATISNNYPPASFFLVGLLGKLVGDPILAGRAVALVSFLIVACNIAIWLRIAGVRTPLAILSAAAFIITLDALSHGSIATDDPQWFAHALVTTGLVVWWRTPSSTPRLTGAAALMLLGGWVKHLMIPLPAAITIWLARTNRRALCKWLAITGLIGALFLSATLAGFGQAFLESVLHAPRRFLFGRAVLMGLSVLPALFPILCLASVAFFCFRKTAASGFALLYFVVASVNAAVASGGDGVSENAFFDVVIAASLAAGLALDGFFRRSPGHSPHLLVTAALIVPAVILFAWTPFSVRSNIERLRALAEEIHATPEDIQFMRERGAGRAACESLSLCFWSGAPFNIDFFNFGQKLKTGRLPMDACAALFDGTRYTVIQMYLAPSNLDARLPAACNRLIAEHYVVVHHSVNGVFLVPRLGTPAA